MRIKPVNDFFNVQRVTKHIGDASVSKRKKLLKYVELYARQCDAMDRKLPAFRVSVNQ